VKQRHIIGSVIALLMIATVACSQSDAGITTAVKAKLAADDMVKAYEVDVDTKDRVVTLSGQVETEAARAQAATLARSTAGVRDVVNNLTVDTSASASERVRDTADRAAGTTGAAVSDAALTAAVKAKLVADPTVGGLSIDVDTDSGVTTLSGRVKAAAEKAQALKLARETDGVKSVIDKLTIGS
jgi:hyperosmotically inducible periplasmic protein